MVKIKYLTGCVKKGDMSIIVKAIPILEEFSEDGYRMTLRQLHYQFVSRLCFPNTKASYKKICEAMKRGRMEGLIDWDMIEDRTRFIRGRPRWDNPADILDACADQFHTDFWQDQTCRVEAWIEKDALIGVIEDKCNHWDCPILSCRGYGSISELHEASKRIKEYAKRGQGFRILYCGDHDPSGMNMCDSTKRILREFGADFKFERIALNIEQIKRFNPPSNPVKMSDTRANGYCKSFGNECWELDTLTPKALNDIVESAIIESIDDMDAFDCRRNEDVEGREKLRIMYENFDTAYELLEAHLAQYRNAITIPTDFSPANIVPVTSIPTFMPIPTE